MTVLLEWTKLGGPDAHASGSQGFVVNEYMELFTFHKVLEMPTKCRCPTVPGGKCCTISQTNATSL